MFLHTMLVENVGDSSYQTNILTPGYKTFSMLNLAEFEIYPAHIC